MKIQQISTDGTIVRTFESRAEIIEAGYDPSHVYKCANGKRKKHKGFIWRFKYDDRKEVPIKSKSLVASYQNESDKTGIKIYNDDIVVNWNNKTIITDLGEFGTYVADFDRMALIQAAYAYDGDGKTQAEIARDFDFMHSKAVAVFAKKHYFTKSSGVHPDIAFLDGLDEDTAVFQNLQRLKRTVYKRSKRQEWRETEKAAMHWWNFENSALEAFGAYMLDFKDKDYKNLGKTFKLRKSKSPYAAIYGLTDVHFMKLCYMAGQLVYDKNIATQRVQKHTEQFAEELAEYGEPEVIYMFIGNDGIHIDGIEHSTTRGTSQHQATDGLFRLSLEEYFDLIVDTVVYASQIAPVVCIPIKGNHDYNMSLVMKAMFKTFFNRLKVVSNISVLDSDESRVYWSYGKTGFMACHGDEMKSTAKLEGQAHKLIMGEAKLHGLNIQDIEQYLILHGHVHVGSFQDLNGNVQRIGLSTLSDTDDWWHKEQGFVGRTIQTMALRIDKEKGLRNIMFIK
jgi:hypothetical protein